MRSRLQENINEKELTLKNSTQLLKGRQWVINAFDSGILSVKGVNVNNNNEYDHSF